MFSTFREYTLDAWDWIIGRKYPRQELLESLRQFPAAPDLKECQSEICANLKPETALVKLEIPPPLKLVRQPRLRLHGMWEREAEAWHDTHPGSSVLITQHVVSHEEF